jgi:hypothetical protein
MKSLNVLNGWAGIGAYIARRSAQSYFGASQSASAASGCGSSCGVGDDGQSKPSSCGSGCGVGESK